jgi:hypothetical protein
LRLRRLIAVSIRLDRSRPIEHHSATVGEPNWQSWTEDRQKEFDARRRWIEKSINSKLTFRKHALAHIRGTGDSSLTSDKARPSTFASTSGVGSGNPTNTGMKRPMTPSSRRQP